MTIKQTNGNERNGIKGSRLNFYRSDAGLVFSMIVPAHSAKHYLNKVNSGKYIEQLKDGLQACKYGYDYRPTTEEAKAVLWNCR